LKNAVLVNLRLHAVIPMGKAECIEIIIIGAVSKAKINEKLLTSVNTYKSIELTPFAPSLWKRGGWW